MRIAVVAACPFPSPQGSQVLVGEMCEALVGRGHDVELLTYGQGSGEAKASGTYRHRRIRRLPGDDALRSGPTLMKPALDLLLARALSRMLRRERFDVVHAHNYEAGAIAVAARVASRVPVVYHGHSIMAEELPSYFSSRVARQCAGLIGTGFDRTVPRAADHVIALSRDAAVTMRRAGVADENLSVVPPALADVGEVPSRAEARRALGLTEARFIIGYCGNLDVYQDLEIVAAAIARMGPSGGTTAPLWLVITHSLDTRFESMIERTGAEPWTRVVLVRSFAEARAGMAACDALALPRRALSGFPIKLLNYMAAARPVVAGIAGERLLGADGALCMPAGDEPTRWVEAFDALRRDSARAEAIGRAARQRFESHHTWDAALPALERAYAKTTGRGKESGSVVPVLR